MFRLLLLLAFLPLPVLAEDATRFCVINASEETYLFVAETREGDRQVQSLAPDQRLCSAGTDAENGVVNVFESADVLEGCGRILQRGETETFVAYAEFDRCAWGAHNDN